MDELITRLLSGDPRALSRLVSLIERGDHRGAEVLAAVYPHTGRAYCIGITGPPGVGKSTLVDHLARIARGHGSSVGILAVDPSSPYTGGAFLGDRIRMQRHTLDPGVFIRSMATREAPGGLPRMVQGAVRLLDASGRDVVIVETAGVGQTELGIMGVADTVVVVLMPETGDAIQTLKAGLMEIADIFVVNKSDREGADRLVVAITSMQQMALVQGDWTPPILTTQAHVGEGVNDLYAGIQCHRDHLIRTTQLERNRAERRGAEFLGTIEEGISRKLRELIMRHQPLGDVFDRVKQGQLEPYSAATELLQGDPPLLMGLADSPRVQ